MTHDVIVIGAGLAGLTAARELTRGGFDAVVLEGRDRVGGRTNSAMLAGVPVDLGASFVGPTQDAVLKLAADLGVDTMPTYNDGTNLIRWRGRVRSYRGTIPRLGLSVPSTSAASSGSSPASPAGVSVAAPWSAYGSQPDTMSLGGWLRSIASCPPDLMAILSR